MGNKTIYVKDDALWERAKQLAGKDGLSAFVSAALEAHIRRNQEWEAGFRTLEERIGTTWVRFTGRLLGKCRFEIHPPDEYVADLDGSPVHAVRAYVTRGRTLVGIIEKASWHPGEDTNWSGAEKSHFTAKSLEEFESTLAETVGSYSKGEGFETFMKEVAAELGEARPTIVIE